MRPERRQVRGRLYGIPRCQRLVGARIGIARTGFFGTHPETDAVIEGIIEVLRNAGAVVVDPADVPYAGSKEAGDVEYEVLLYEFQADMANYLATRVPVDASMPQPRTLAELIAFNTDNADKELPHFGQEIFEMAAAKGPLTEQAYLDAIAASRRMSREEGIDKVMDEHQLDAILAPTGGPAWAVNYETGDKFTGGSSRPAAMAGYPLLTIPAGFVGALPVGVTLMGRAYSEATLIRLGYALEQLIQARRAPEFREIFD
ncbi:MAG: amidase family protein [Caldilineaceae bacterium]